MSARTYRVYGLADPDEPGVIRYVGATSKPLSWRLSGHCCTAKKNKNECQKWILGLLGKGKKPIIVELEECGESNHKSVEAKWIGNFRISGNQYSLNHQLPGFDDSTKKNYYFKDRLLNWRGSLTQKEAAAVLGVSLGTYRNWEYGVNIPSVLAMKEVDRFLAKPAQEWQSPVPAP